jgi:hypothetical protein
MRRSLWIVASALIALSIAEITARHEGFGKPLLYRAAPSGYELVPDQHVVRLGKTTTINAFGTRGANLAPQPTPGVWRIMVLGDSVANGGTQINDGQTLAAVASRQLKQFGCRNQILNASAGGWSLFDESAWLYHHGLLGAKTILWTINFADLDQPPNTSAILDSNPGFPSHRPVFGLQEILFRYALPRLGLSPATADNGSVVGYQFDDRTFSNVLQLVRRMKRELDAKGVRLIVVYHDGPGPMPERRQAAKRTLLEELARQGIPVIKTGLSTTQKPRDLFIDGIHPNAIGSTLVGQRIAIALQGQCPRS